MATLRKSIQDVGVLTDVTDKVRIELIRDKNPNNTIDLPQGSITKHGTIQLINSFDSTSLELAPTAKALTDGLESNSTKYNGTSYSFTDFRNDFPFQGSMEFGPFRFAFGEVGNRQQDNTDDRDSTERVTFSSSFSKIYIALMSPRAGTNGGEGGNTAYLRRVTESYIDVSGGVFVWPITWLVIGEK